MQVLPYAQPDIRTVLKGLCHSDAGLVEWGAPNHWSVRAKTSVLLSAPGLSCSYSTPLSTGSSTLALPFSVPIRPLAAGYHTIKGLAAPLQDLAEACAMLPTCLAFSNQGRVGGKEDTL